MKIIYLSISLFISIAVISSACTGTYGGGDTIVFPEKNVSFLLHVKPFLQQNCAYSPCHFSPSDPQSGGIVLTEYYNVIITSGFIAPTNPDASRFVQILENRLPHITNFYRGNITQNQIDGVRQWIIEGAINN